LAQRIYQIGCAYEDGNDANTLRSDPLFKLGLDHRPLDTETDLASAPTFSRLENAASTQDIYRVTQAFVDQFIASYSKPPKLIVPDRDHSEDTTYGQQQLSYYNHHYRSYCYLPLFLFEGISGRFITAALRPGKRPKQGSGDHDPQAGTEASACRLAQDPYRAAWRRPFLQPRVDGVGTR
jgi:hypothetical protein